MSAWPSRSETLYGWQPPALFATLASSARRINLRVALWLGCLIFALTTEGMAITHSYLWAAPLVCLLIVAVAIEIPLVPFLGLSIFIRVLTDSSLSSQNIRHTGSLNLSAAIAVLFILVAIGLLLHRQRGFRPTALAVLWLGLWTAIAVISQGVSAETIREGVREGSIIALFVIVYNSRNILNILVVTRLIQVVGFAAALVALYQFATHTGMEVSGEIRSNGTFSHPNGAAMYFAIATTVSVWRYLAHGRRRVDIILATVCAGGAITTFSIGGLASLLAMLITLGALIPKSRRVKYGSYAMAGVIVIAFLATPLGAKRLENESSTQLNSNQVSGAASTSLGWRFYKWLTLIPEWERSPFFGQGLGTTVTTEGTSQNVTAGEVPHNEYLRYLVETGVIGLTFLLIAVYALIRRLAQQRALSDTRYTGALGIAIVVGCIFNALGDNTFLYSTTGYAVALIIAAALTTSGID